MTAASTFDANTYGVQAAMGTITVSNISPSPGSSLNPPTGQTVSFDLTTTAQSGFGTVSLHVDYTGGRSEIAYADAVFISEFLAQSVATPIAGGFHFDVERDALGWLEDFNLQIVATDCTGASTTPSPFSIDYLVPNGAGPVIALGGRNNPKLIRQGP